MCPFYLLYYILAILIHTYCFSEYLPFDIKCHIFSGLYAPLYKGETSIFDFDTGDAARMYTAPGVTIRRNGSAYHGMVSVPGDEQPVCGGGPGSQPFFGFFLSDIVFGGTGRVGDSQAFQRLPDITDEEACQWPECTVK